MIFDHFKRKTVVVEIFENRMSFRCGESTVTVEAQAPFSTRRLLVGTFSPAVECMRDGLQRSLSHGFLVLNPEVQIIPKSMVDGGLSEIEQRCLLEVAYSAGASKAEIRTG